VRHARDAALDSIETILAELRALPGLKEKKRGTFYRKSSGFIHFHEDPQGMFADLKSQGDFVRFPLKRREQISSFLRAARKAAQS